jgi:hypothetical protein
MEGQLGRCSLWNKNYPQLFNLKNASPKYNPCIASGSKPIVWRKIGEHFEALPQKLLQLPLATSQ